MPSSEKSSQAFRTISEVANELGLATHVLRFWESKFPQVKPLKRAGGRRYYRPEDVAILKRLQTLLHDEGYTIKGVQKILREDGLRKFVEDTATESDVEALTAPEADTDPQALVPRLAEQTPPPPVQTAQQPNDVKKPTGPQASLFDTVAPQQSTADETPPESIEITPAEPATPFPPVSYSPDLLPEAPEPLPIEENNDPLVLFHGINETQRSTLLEVLGEMKKLKEKIDQVA